MSAERERWRPPLATQLFEPRDSFNQIRVRYPGARRLAQVLQPKADRGVLDVENELRRLAQSSDDPTRRHFLDIPPYLRDLTWAIGRDPLRSPGLGYVQDPGSYQELVHKLLVEADCDVAFVVLNYDSLLERALTDYDPRTYSFETIDDYADSERRAIVIKAHGSVDWWVPLASKAPSWSDAVTDAGLPDLASDGLVLVESGVQYSNEARTGDHSGASWLYPVITAPLAGKGPEALVCPTAHLAALGEFLKSCHKLLFVGTSGFDLDVLDFVGQHVVSGALANFIGGGNNEEGQKARDRVVAALAAKLANVELDTGSDTYLKGFRQYLTTPLLDRFLTHSVGSQVAEGRRGTPLVAQLPTSREVKY